MSNIFYVIRWPNGRWSADTPRSYEELRERWRKWPPTGEWQEGNQCTDYDLYNAAVAAACVEAATVDEAIEKAKGAA